MLLAISDASVLVDMADTYFLGLLTKQQLGNNAEGR
jgi:hypothetical protein